MAKGAAYWLDSKNIQVYSLKLVVREETPGCPGWRTTGLQAPDAHRLMMKLSRKIVLPNLVQPGGHPAPLPWGWLPLPPLGKAASSLGGRATLITWGCPP